MGRRMDRDVMTPGLTDRDRDDLRASVGTHQGERPLMPVEVSELFARLRDGGATNKEIATVAGLQGSSMVSRFLRLRDLAPELAMLVDWGSSPTGIAFSAAAELGRLEPDAQRAVARVAAASRLSASEVGDVVLRLAHSTRAPDEAVADILALRSQPELRHLYFGRFDDTGLSERIAPLTAAERDGVMRRALDILVAGGAQDQIGSRLTRTTWMIAAGAATAPALNALPDVDAAVADAVRRALDAT